MLPRVSGGNIVCWHLDFRLWPPELWENTFLLFYTTQFVMAAPGDQYRVLSPSDWVLQRLRRVQMPPSLFHTAHNTGTYWEWISYKKYCKREVKSLFPSTSQWSSSPVLWKQSASSFPLKYSYLALVSQLLLPGPSQAIHFPSDFGQWGDPGCRALGKVTTFAEPLKVAYIP